ncbi:hypothetical protein [Streptomyces sp. NPDC001999]
MEPKRRKPEPGGLSPNRHSHLEELLDQFEANLNLHDPVHRKAAQLGNLAVQVFAEYADLLSEAHHHLPEAERDRVISMHGARALEGLNRLKEILDLDD